MSDKSKSAAQVLGECVFSLMWIPAAVLVGFTLGKLWGWFIAPAFGLPALSMLNAFGLALVVSYVVPVSPRGKKNEIEDEWWYGPAYGIMKCGLYLGLAWLSLRVLA